MEEDRALVSAVAPGSRKHKAILVRWLALLQHPLCMPALPVPMPPCTLPNGKVSCCLRVCVMRPAGQAPIQLFDCREYCLLHSTVICF